MLGSDETGQMANVLCRDDPIHGQGLGCQNHVAIQSLGVSGWHPAPPDVSPELCRLLHDRRGDRQIPDRALEKVEPGEPPHRSALGGNAARGVLGKQAAQQLGLGGRVAFTGFLTKEQLIKVYYESHLFIHPSETTSAGDNEGIPNSLLEAMATGLCSIATRHGGIPEAVEHLQNGVLVEERDFEGVHSWMTRLTDNWSLAVELGRRASETISREFDSETQIQKLESVYLELIERTGVAKA